MVVLIFLLGLILGFIIGVAILYSSSKKNKKEEGEKINFFLPLSSREEHRTPSYAVILNQLLSLYRNLLNAEGVVLLKMVNENFLEAIASSPGVDFNPAKINAKDGLYGIALNEDKGVIAKIVQPQALKHLSNVNEACSILYYPISRMGNIEGILALHRGIDNPFTEKELLVAKRAAIFLHEIDLFAQRLRKLEILRVRWERTENGIKELLKDLKESSPDDIAATMVKTIVEILPVRYAFIAIQSSQYDFGCLITHGFPPSDIESLEPNTWAYYVFTHPEEFIYLSETMSRETKMPILYPKEKFPHDRVVYLQKIESKEHTLGVIGLIGSSKEFVEEDRAFVYLFVKEASLILEFALLNQSLKKLAIKDPLTNLYNRRYFEERYHQEFSRSKRNSEPFSVMVLDIDHFKKINDTYGHPVGDMVLKEVSKRISSNVREMDVICRYGGEEFIITLPNCKINDAFDIGERIRKAISSTPIKIGNMELNVTISVGVSSYPEITESENKLILLADEALYEAKNNGRNMVLKAKKK